MEIWKEPLKVAMKPPLSYYGGKQRMSRHLIQLIPQHTTYVEPFCGGAAILFAKPFPKVTNSHFYREFINDLDGNLVNFFTQLRDNGEELIGFLQMTPYSEKIHMGYKSKNFHKFNDLERAAAYWYNIMTSFSKKIDGGWAKTTRTQNIMHTIINKIDNLQNYIDRMKTIGIFNRQANDIIKAMDTPHTFFYCDPPYPNSNQAYAKRGFKEKDFQELVDLLESCEGSFMLSCYENMKVKIPDTWQKFQFNSYCSAKGMEKGMTRENTSRTETVYRRFHKGVLRKDIQKLFDSGCFDCFERKTPTLEWEFINGKKQKRA
jgi:DNA adenine methylase